MQRILAALIVALMIFTLAAPTALAATADEEGVVVTITDPAGESDTDSGPDADEAEANPEEETGAAKAPGKILTPESPFYFLKRFVESIRLFLTLDGEKKAQLLSDLAEERAKELEALQEKFADGQLTEKQFKLLEKALEDLILFTEKLADALADEDSAPSDQEQGEEAQDPAAGDQDEASTEEDEAVTDPEENPNDDHEDEESDLDPDKETDADKDGKCPDKYLKRVAHLQAIAERAPEAAQKGLARAIANALRQRERAIAKGKIPCPSLEDDAEDEETYSERDKDFSCKDEDRASKTWNKAEKEKQKLNQKDKPQRTVDKDRRWPAKFSPGKGKGKFKGKGY